MESSVKSFQDRHWRAALRAQRLWRSHSGVAEYEYRICSDDH